MSASLVGSEMCIRDSSRILRFRSSRSGVTEATAPEPTATCTRAALAQFDCVGTQTLRVAARAIALVVAQGR
eukprot:4244797-Alexandrium_andersonii.AAC.1